MAEFFQHLINGISLGSIYALIAIGYSMVYGILQLINFAHGEVVMLGAVTGFFVAPLFGRPVHPSLGLFLSVLLISMVVCSIVGLLIERIAYRPLRKSPRINCLITAIGVSLFIQYFTQLDFIFGAIPQSYPELIERQIVFSIGGLEISNLQILVLGLSFSLMGILEFIVFRTKMGKAMRAVSESPEIASLLGIPVNRVIAFTFVLGSCLAAAAGTLVATMYPKVDALMGALLGLKAFVAAVLGGIGSISGAVLGGLLMGLAEEYTVGYLSSSFRDAIAFTILILILLVRPSGLLGTSRIEKV
ncbi:MAG: High-affinity branched-chain amino acid transport system permease protein LivH [Bacteriovoracaceae bacterium]|nr:High-affinity branched-chain amino acid transport system permease protein LivH [Bacteriovoracaceae bacterium]